MAKKDIKKGHFDLAGYFRIFVQYTEDGSDYQECVELKYPRTLSHPSKKKDLEDAIAADLERIRLMREEVI